MTGAVEPVFMGRWDKLKLGLVTLAIGVLVYSWSPIAARLFIGIGGLLIFSAVIRGKERIV